MTPEQKLKWAVLSRASKWTHSGIAEPPYPCSDIDELYADAEDNDESDVIEDIKNEVRCGGIATGLKAPRYRHCESKSVAMQFPDGSWVGWTYWYGGGKHAQPQYIDWMDESYDLKCTEEQKLVTVRTFEKVGA